MTISQFMIAVELGKVTAKVSKGSDVRYTLGSSLEHLKTRFIGPKWEIVQVSYTEFIENYKFEEDPNRFSDLSRARELQIP